MLDVSTYIFSCVRYNIHISNWKYLLDVFYEFFREANSALQDDPLKKYKFANSEDDEDESNAEENTEQTSVAEGLKWKYQVNI
jgi:hypothetical protein